MKWDDKNHHWLIAPGSKAFDLLQAARKAERADHAAWGALAGRISEQFGLPKLEAVSFNQGGRGGPGQTPIVDMTVFGDAAYIESVTRVDPKSWRKPTPADGGYPLKVKLHKGGRIAKALPEMSADTPSYFIGMIGHMARRLEKAARVKGGLDAIFYHPGYTLLPRGEHAEGAIFVTNDNSHLVDWADALRLTGARSIGCYEAMKAYHASLGSGHPEAASA